MFPECRQQSVGIRGFSVAFAGGIGQKSLIQALERNESKLGQLTLFELPFSTRVGQIRETLPEIQSHLQQYDSRNARLALAVIDCAADGLREAVQSARERFGPDRIGVVVGTSTSGLLETESAYKNLLNDGAMPDNFHFLSRHVYQATPRFLQKELELEGPCYAISTACSSGAKSIGAGQRLIQNGVCDAVLVGGVDSLCRLTLRGFNSLELVSGSQCRPMDEHRDGINIGEGGGLLLLEKRAPESDFPFHLLSVGESSDAYHMSSPHPDGLGAVLAMQNALQLAGIDSETIDYLNLHGTATVVNDRVEAKAVASIYGSRIPVSASKGITGHTLGAAGAIECIIALLALKHGFIPGTCGLSVVDPEFQCNIVHEPRSVPQLKTAMSNSFGFGGNNACVIVASG